MEVATLDQLDVAYEEHGERDKQPPLILLHGFPDDASAWRAVGGHIAAAGRHALAPYVRGCGPTRFRSADVPRSGQVAARARDTLALMDAVKLERIVLVGQDWGAATAQAIAMLHPERVERLVILNGHALFNMAVFAQGKRPSWSTLHAGWYQWLFQSPLAQPLVDGDRVEFARYLWRIWSPGWNFDDATFRDTARSFGNPDWTDVVLSAYRPWTDDPNADPVDAEASKRLAATPPITRPVLNLQGAEDGVDLFADTQLGQEAFYQGGFEREVLAGCGHFLHRERPEQVAALIRDFVDAR